MMIRKKLQPYVENMTEAGCACLITMVQGNLLILNAAHWLIATQTGLIAGSLAGTLTLVTGAKKQWLISLTLGIVTAIADYFVHAGASPGSGLVESTMTGLCAAALSLTVSRALEAGRQRRRAAKT